LIHFELILVQGERQESSFSLLHLAVFPTAFDFSPSCVLGSFIEDQLAIDAWVYLWILHTDPVVFLSVLVPIHAVFIFMAM
jgi:hypothetical protein